MALLPRSTGSGVPDFASSGTKCVTPLCVRCNTSGLEALAAVVSAPAEPETAGCREPARSTTSGKDTPRPRTCSASHSSGLALQSTASSAMAIALPSDPTISATSGDGWHSPSSKDVQRTLAEPSTVSAGTAALSSTSTRTRPMGCSTAKASGTWPALNLDTWSWKLTCPQFICGLVSSECPFTSILTLYFLWDCVVPRPMTRNG
mmetsp:Transcript_132163/g.368403  ORF Transcript_132163/g.368403 Transcript_132163/m.368403 type:complete len:205 (-) Transcript_132163:920-1534(-)